MEHNRKKQCWDGLYLAEKILLIRRPDYRTVFKSRTDKRNIEPSKSMNILEKLRSSINKAKSLVGCFELLDRVWHS